MREDPTPLNMSGMLVYVYACVCVLGPTHTHRHTHTCTHLLHVSYSDYVWVEKGICVWVCTDRLHPLRYFTPHTTIQIDLDRRTSDLENALVSTAATRIPYRGDMRPRGGCAVTRDENLFICPMHRTAGRGIHRKIEQ